MCLNCQLVGQKLNQAIIIGRKASTIIVVVAEVSTADGGGGGGDGDGGAYCYVVYRNTNVQFV